MSVTEKIPARDILTFKEPHPIPLLQRVGFFANRVFNLAFGAAGLGRLTPVIAAEDLRQLRAIPRHAGNMLVGPHPGSHDAYLMYYLCSRARQTSACFMIAAEPFAKRSRLGRAVIGWMGGLPVARGRKNPQAIEYMTRALSEGNWTGIYPEGEMYYSREVMPMEYGAVRIAVAAALRIQKQARARGIPESGWRPVLITPFAQVYFFSNEEKSLRRIQAALAELESRSEFFGEVRPGDFRNRLRALAGKVMEFKAQRYAVSREQWKGDDRFDRARKLQEVVLCDLERRYLGRIQKGYPRRRALKIRMKLFERLRDSQLSEAREREVHVDIEKTRDIVMIAPFTPRYVDKYGDLEMWGEYLRRIRNSLRLGETNLGPQTVVFKILPSVDAHQIASRYDEFNSHADRQVYLYETTEELRGRIQKGVDSICREHPTLKMPPPEPSG